MEYKANNLETTDYKPKNIITIIDSDQDVEVIADIGNDGRFKILGQKSITLGQHTGIDNDGGIIDFLIIGRSGNIFECILTDFAVTKEKREFKRFPYKAPLQVKLDGRSMLVVSEDLSLGGMCFKCIAPLDKGKDCTIKVDAKELWVPGKIMWNKPVKSGYKHGMEFICENELRDKVEKFVKTLG